MMPSSSPTPPTKLQWKSIRRCLKSRLRMMFVLPPSPSPYPEESQGALQDPWVPGINPFLEFLTVSTESLPDIL